MLLSVFFAFFFFTLYSSKVGNLNLFTFKMKSKKGFSVQDYVRFYTKSTSMFSLVVGNIRGDLSVLSISLLF